MKNPFLLLVLIIGLLAVLTGQVAAQNLNIIYSFTPTTILFGGTNNDGANPQCALIASGDTLYGTAQFGGTSANGTVFRINTDGTSFTNLHNFPSTSGPVNIWPTNSDGANPRAGLVLSSNTLYGTAFWGGASGNGTVFRLNTDGTGFTNLYDFTDNVGSLTNSDGANPYAGLVLWGNTLYGTAVNGGDFGNGTVFRINTDGTGFTNLHSFTAGQSYPNETNSDGAFPWGGLVVSGNSLYGTAGYGGSAGLGTIFKLNTDGTGFTNIHSFLGFPNEGAVPTAGLRLSDNVLYGTTHNGGVLEDIGTVFAINVDGTGFTNLHSFDFHTDGAGPDSGVILSGKNLYGTAVNGGSNYRGTIFALTTNGTEFTVLYNFDYFDGLEPAGGLILWGNILYGTTPLSGSPLDYGNGMVFSLLFEATPPTISCSAPLMLECENGSAVGTVQAEAQDINGYPLQVVWTVDATAVQTNDIPFGGNLTASNVTFTANFGFGEHVVVVSASNGQTDPVTCSTTVTVHGTTPPQIKSIVATPNVLWPPNHRMIPVHLRVDAVDACDPSPVVKIISVTSNEPMNRLAPDWEITGAQRLNLRAERLGKGHGRIYTIVVECKDESGNASTASVTVTVPHN